MNWPAALDEPSQANVDFISNALVDIGGVPEIDEWRWQVFRYATFASDLIHLKLWLPERLRGPFIAAYTVRLLTRDNLPF